MINYPTSLDTLTDPAVGSKLSTIPHSTLETNQNDAIEALEAKVGINGSGVSTSLDYKVTNASSVSPGHKHVVADINDFASSIAAILPIGAILPYGGSSAPTGFVLCDGTSLLRAGTYASLFAIIGTTYGTADGTHFTVPDLRGRVSVGAGTGAGLTARTLAATGGEETHQLITAELPSHTHTIADTFGASGIGTVGSSGVAHGASTTGSAGSDTAHNTMQPFLVLNHIIKY